MRTSSTIFINDIETREAWDTCCNELWLTHWKGMEC